MHLKKIFSVSSIEEGKQENSLERNRSHETLTTLCTLPRSLKILVFHYFPYLCHFAAVFAVAIGIRSLRRRMRCREFRYCTILFLLVTNIFYTHGESTSFLMLPTQKLYGGSKAGGFIGKKSLLLSIDKALHSTSSLKSKIEATGFPFILSFWRFAPVFAVAIIGIRSLQRRTRCREVWYCTILFSVITNIFYTDDESTGFSYSEENLPQIIQRKAQQNRST